ncbi:hypothetical protein [Vampirovibrio sp.]|uniref:hypothetical protein n=1 Tax=Vampirovibrio sp. TaxID=2717857 RepID=UPI003593272E
MNDILQASVNRDSVCPPLYQSQKQDQKNEAISNGLLLGLAPLNACLGAPL